MDKTRTILICQQPIARRATVPPQSHSPSCRARPAFFNHSTMAHRTALHPLEDASRMRVSYTLPPLLSFQDDHEHRYLPDERGMHAQSLPVLDLPTTREKPHTRTVFGSSFPRVEHSPKYSVRLHELAPEHARARHLRPINALALDVRENDSSRLFSAGIDGLVCVWDLGSLGAPMCPRFSKHIRAHRNRIWDMKYVPNQDVVVTCSSDCTIKAWNPDTPASNTYELGTHADYVKSLAPSYGSDWIASGSLDQKLCLWDLREGRKDPMWQVATPSSIYVVGSNRSGSVIATAGVDRRVRGWDPRMRGSAFELVGHEDLVRTMVMSADGEHLLSGSSDSTVRLWSTKEQRCLCTYSHHNASVWSLYSQDDNLSTFYSGDRDGFLCKIFLDPNHQPQNDRCVVLAQESIDPNSPSKAGIASIMAYNDQYVWTSNTISPSFQCWQDIKNPDVSSSSLVNLHDPDMLQFFTQLPANTVHQEAGSQYLVSEAFSVFDRPLYEVVGFHGILRGAFLNDRIHVLTIDSGGIVALWNVFHGSCIGTFDVHAVNNAAMVQGVPPTWRPQHTPSGTLELVQNIIEGEGVTLPWCTLDTTSGLLTVSIDETKIWSSDMYLDELHEMLGNPSTSAWSEDRVVLGVCVIRNLFKHMFLAEMQMRGNNREGLPMLLEWLKQLGLSPEALMHVPLCQLPSGPQTARMNETYHSILSKMSALHASIHLDILSSSEEVSTLEYEIVQHLHKMLAKDVPSPHMVPESSTSPPEPSTFFGTFRRNTSKRKVPSQLVPSAKKDDAQNKLDYANALSNLYCNAWRDTSPLTGIPNIQYSSMMSIEIVREDRVNGKQTVAYRGSVGSVGVDTPLLELMAPYWLLSVVLSPEIVQVEGPLVKVVLQKWSSNASTSGTLNASLELEPLSAEDGTLTVPRNLRVARIADYIKHTLTSKGCTISTPTDNPVDIPIDILCNGYHVPARYTIAQCQVYCWQNITPGMIRLRYRRRSSRLSIAL